MNDEPVVLFQVSNPVLDVSGRVAVSMLVSKAITTEEFEERLSDLLRNMESLALLKVECDNTSHLRRSALQPGPGWPIVPDGRRSKDAR